MSVLDISRAISPSSVVFPGDEPLGAAAVCDISPGCPCRITTLSGWSTHFLTHVDAPRHFYLNGVTLDAIPLGRFICEAQVVEIEGDFVAAHHIERLSDLRNTAILFKTKNSKIKTDAPFFEQHAFVSAEAAELLVKKRANLVGIDYLSIDRFGDDIYPAHKTFLGNNVLVLEGLDLSPISQGSYHLAAVPLKIKDADGSPVRAILY